MIQSSAGFSRWLTTLPVQQFILRLILSPFAVSAFLSLATTSGGIGVFWWTDYNSTTSCYHCIGTLCPHPPPPPTSPHWLHYCCHSHCFHVILWRSDSSHSRYPSRAFPFSKRSFFFKFFIFVTWSSGDFILAGLVCATLLLLYIHNGILSDANDALTFLQLVMFWQNSEIRKDQSVHCP